MNKIKLTTLAILASLGMSSAAMAASADANFASTVQSYCTIGQTSPGVMHMDGKNITTDTPAELVVNNNEANIYKVGVTAPSDFTSKPNSYTGTTAFNASFSMVGANNTTNPVADGQFHNLTASGSDAMSISIHGGSDLDYIAGNYTAVVVASCVAQ